jgi:hypothetical protein
MPKFVVKLKDKYLEWSTVVAAPVTRGMTREQMARYLMQRETELAERSVEEVLKRADEYGTSRFPWEEGIRAALVCNRAGDGEVEITQDEIYEKYCTPKAEGGGAD